MSNILTGNIQNAIICTVTYDPTGIAANTSVEETLTVSGVKVGDIVFVNKPTATAGAGIVGARVSAADTVGITWMNTTAATVNPGSETYTLLIVRPEAARTNAFM